MPLWRAKSQNTQVQEKNAENFYINSISLVFLSRPRPTGCNLIMVQTHLLTPPSSV